MKHPVFFLLLVFLPFFTFAQDNEWTPVNNGLNNQTIYALAEDPGDPNILYAGSDNGCYRSTNRGESWANISQGLPVRSVWVSDNGRVVIIANAGGSRSDGLWISRDGGDNFEVFSWMMWPYAIAVNPENNDQVIAGLRDQGIRYTLDGGQNWLEGNRGLPDGAITHLLISNTEDEDYVFASTARGLYRCTISENLQWEQAGPHELPVLQTALDYDVEGGIYAGTNDESDSDGVFHSTDLGGEWDIVRYCYYVTAIATKPELLVYASGEIGVMRSTDGGENEIEMNEGLPGTDFSDLLIQIVDEQITYFGSTPGEGVFMFVQDNGAGDRPPSDFGLIEPANAAILEDNIITFAWGESIDPDPEDTVSYVLSIDLGEEEIQFETDRTEFIVDQENVIVDFPLRTILTWWVTAVSGDLTTECEERFVFAIGHPDRPPSLFSLLNPPDQSEIRHGEQEISFTWEASEDPDPGDLVSYQWWIFAGMDSSHIEDIDTTEISVMVDDLNLPLLNGTEITWLVRAESGMFSTDCARPFTLQYLWESVDGDPALSVRDFQLLPAFPNPFNSSATVGFYLRRPGEVTLRMADVSGRTVDILTHSYYASGYHSVNLNGGALTNGQYTIILQSPTGVESQPLILLK